MAFVFSGVRPLRVKTRSFDYPMTWFEHIKAYFWNDQTTPYLVRPDRLNPLQREKELFAYTIFLMVLFGVTMLGAFDHWNKHGESLSFFVGVHSITVIATAWLLGWRHHSLPASYLLSAPIVAFVIVLSDGLGMTLNTVERIFLLVFTLAWGRYGLRVVRITQSEPYLGGDEIQAPPEPTMADRLAARLDLLNRSPQESAEEQPARDTRKDQG